MANKESQHFEWSSSSGQILSDNNLRYRLEGTRRCFIFVWDNVVAHPVIAWSAKGFGDVHWSRESEKQMLHMNYLADLDISTAQELPFVHVIYFNQLAVILVDNNTSYSELTPGIIV